MIAGQQLLVGGSLFECLEGRGEADSQLVVAGLVGKREEVAVVVGQQARAVVHLILQPLSVQQVATDPLVEHHPVQTTGHHQMQLFDGIPLPRHRHPDHLGIGQKIGAVGIIFLNTYPQTLEVGELLEIHRTGRRIEEHLAAVRERLFGVVEPVLAGRFKEDIEHRIPLPETGLLQNPLPGQHPDFSAITHLAQHGAGQIEIGAGQLAIVTTHHIRGPQLGQQRQCRRLVRCYGRTSTKQGDEQPAVQPDPSPTLTPHHGDPSWSVWIEDIQGMSNKKGGRSLLDIHSLNGTYSAFRIASTLALASPNSIWVFSLKNSGFWTPA